MMAAGAMKKTRGLAVSAERRPSRRQLTVAPAADPEAEVRCVVGVVVAGPAGKIHVDYVGNPRGPDTARTLFPVDGGAVARALPPGREVVLLLDPAADGPVLLGTFNPLGFPGVAQAGEARVDGRRVVIEGADEIQLVCGEASLTLRRNGRAVLRGVEVETRAKGKNRIRGGTVAIN